MDRLSSHQICGQQACGTRPRSCPSFSFLTIRGRARTHLVLPLPVLWKPHLRCERSRNFNPNHAQQNQPVCGARNICARTRCRFNVPIFCHRRSAIARWRHRLTVAIGIPSVEHAEHNRRHQLKCPKRKKPSGGCWGSKEFLRKENPERGRSLRNRHCIFDRIKQLSKPKNRTRCVKLGQRADAKQNPPPQPQPPPRGNSRAAKQSPKPRAAKSDLAATSINQ
jgi:hypothetical protein